MDGSEEDMKDSRGLPALVLVVAVLGVRFSFAYIPYGSALGPRRETILWQVQLDPQQCTTARSVPCYNIYALRDGDGALVWYAFTTVRMPKSTGWNGALSGVAKATTAHSLRQ